MDTVRVQVPATSANLGPGFDCMGMAIELTSAATIRLADEFDVTVSGEGAEFIDRSRRNHVHRGVTAVYERLGRPLPAVAIEIESAIPISRGLGSSASAVAAGLTAANVLTGTELDRDELVRLGAGIEGHPDNIAPALIGGCVIAAKTNESFQIAQVPIGPNLGIVLFIPELRMKTVDARRVVPETISRTDAVFNASRTALLTLALATERYDLLRLALEDRVHQHYREQLFPEMPKLFAAALDAGAFGVYLSGAGSTIGAFAAGNEQEIEAAFVEESRRLDVPGATLVTRPSQGGAQVEPGTDRG